MRLLFLVLLLLALIIQYPLWWGKGGWGRVHELQKQVATQHDTNDALLARNNALAAEVQDLKTGTQAVEERARGELGMVKDGEIFVQILAPHEKGPSVSTPALASPEQKKGN
ncbi:cell division protein FtsB [Paralcaligenes ureilyticus]|jgi:cell division protein FtsB|uniref:Cell division protein FtsB n=1 Tax=Paralcaligenes ureilyticus TaxID=627131 RepID=A0A4R3M8D0_9BURK|nr:cell division protein FtsB [Paralcaligenes ureilyticus]TCT08549.1 cell division protein FtsB [Paralcaligenes ureilyticus]